MARRIEVRDAGKVIGWVVEGSTWKDAPGYRSTDILLVGARYAWVEELFYRRSQRLPPSQSEGRTYQDEYSFHFSE